METITLFDSELKVMEIIWEAGRITAKEVSLQAEALFGWNKNTTYTVLKKLVDKKAISRNEPSFTCEPLVTKEEVQLDEAKKLIDKLFEGSSKLMLSRFIEEEEMSRDELQALKDLINKKL